ncbi:MAG: isoprenyl transferase [Deltaproteobacteria bacterium]|jgi:undecaprenyl diphosphate synthase|nr:isoprenyl transferase [Deltaproteobacteria bacterium]
MRIPHHLAIIMDGNGRWAEKRHLPRIIGHRKGVETVQQIVATCRKQGVKFLTLFAFSSENWGRPHDEVDALMRLLGTFLEKELSRLLEQGIRLRVIGETGRLPGQVLRILQEVMSQTEANDKMTLCLALSYGSRNEMVRAFRKIGDQIACGKVLPEQISEKMISETLDTNGIPDPDLLIRTSGETRISNFLLWQLAYTELYFSEKLWPEFTSSELLEAFADFSQRQRRFGLTGAQMEGEEITHQEGRH